MALIAVTGDKGSPGVTTTAVALAGVWPRRAILAECDPAGGDLVYRSPADTGGPLNPNIGMLSLATMARHGLSAHQLGDHLQQMHGGLEVVVGLATGDQSAGLTGLWSNLGKAFDSLPDADVIADCGRVDSTSASLDLMAGAALVILVARTTAEQIAHVRDRALSLAQRIGGGNAIKTGGLGVQIGVLLIVDPKQRNRVTSQVDELLRNSGLPVKVIGTIADDPDGADLLGGRGRGRLDKTLLIRSAREVALDVYRRFALPGQIPPSAPAGGASQGAAAPAERPLPPKPAPERPLPQRPEPPRGDRPEPPRPDRPEPQRPDRPVPPQPERSAPLRPEPPAERPLPPRPEPQPDRLAPPRPMPQPDHSAPMSPQPGGRRGLPSPQDQPLPAGHNFTPIGQSAPTPTFNPGPPQGQPVPGPDPGYPAPPLEGRLLPPGSNSGYLPPPPADRYDVQPGQADGYLPPPTDRYDAQPANGYLPQPPVDNYDTQPGQAASGYLPRPTYDELDDAPRGDWR